MVTEHIATQPHDKVPAQAAPKLAQATLDGGSEPIVTSDASDAQKAPRKPRGPKRTDEQRIADAKAEIERVKGKAKAKVAEGLAALKADLDTLVADADRAEMPTVAAELKKLVPLLAKVDGAAK